MAESIATTSGVKLHLPGSCLIIGPTHSGKTTLTFNILLERDRLFETQNGEGIEDIRYIYGSTWQPVFTEMEKKMPITFHKGLPENMQDFIEDSEVKNGIVVIDDMQQDLAKSKDALDLVIKHSHHMNKFTIIILHSPFAKGNFIHMRENTEVIFMMGFMSEMARIKRFLSHFTANGQQSSELIQWYKSTCKEVGDYICINCSLRLQDKALMFTTNITGREGKFCRNFVFTKQK